jgi:hypothetical protein
VVPVVVELPEVVVSVVRVDELRDVVETDVEDTVVLDVSDVVLAVVEDTVVLDVSDVVTPSPNQSVPD